MDSLTPFVRHDLTERPGASGAPQAVGSRLSPPLGTPPLQPPALPDDPGTQLPPPEFPAPESAPHPDPGAEPSAGVPVTDGTPAGCYQKNAAAFLSGRVPGVMAQYGEGLFGADQQLYTAQPAPEDGSGVQELVDWRENAPYG